MITEQTEVRSGGGSQAQLENAFIAEYLGSCGYSPASLRKLPANEVRRLMAEASLYASTRLCEVETRSRFVHEMHGVVPVH